MALAMLLMSIAGVPAQGLWRELMREPSSGFWFFDPPVGKWSGSSILGGYKIAAKADFNRDGLPDFASGGDYAVTVHVNRGFGRFEVSWEYNMPWPPAPPGVPMITGCAAADFDGDGDDDLIVAQSDFIAATVSFPCLLFLNDGTGRFTPAPPGYLPPTAANAACAAAADVDLDGDVDIVFGGGGWGLAVGPIRLFLNDGTGRFQDVTSTHMPVTFWHPVRILLLDCDHDSYPDLVAACGYNVYNEPNLFMRNLGNGRFAAPSLDARLGFSKAVAAADFNGDSHVDLVFATSGVSDDDRLYYGDGRGGFTYVALPRPTAPTREYAALDFDDDGDVDLLRTDYDLRLYRNSGNGVFKDDTAALAYHARYQQVWFEWLFPHDWDADGDSDVLAYGRGPDPTVGPHLLANLRRHLYTQERLVVGYPHKLELFADPGHIVAPALAARGALLYLGPLGWLGLDPTSLVLLPAATSPLTRRTVQLVPMPNDPRLRGSEVWSQALVLDPAVPNAARLTNWRRDVVQ